MVTFNSNALVLLKELVSTKRGYCLLPEATYCSERITNAPEGPLTSHSKSLTTFKSLIIQ